MEMEIEISYRQVAVFNSDLENPFNDWTKGHTDQGFTWREFSVSFLALIDAGLASVNVDFRNDFIPREESARVIVVPFEVDDNEKVEIASIADGQVIDFPKGHYDLFYEALDNKIYLTFVKSSQPRFEIIRADEWLSPTYPLLTDAEPA